MMEGQIERDLLTLAPMRDGSSQAFAERRERIATAVLVGMLAFDTPYVRACPGAACETACNLAACLIAELDKEK